MLGLNYCLSVYKDLIWNVPMADFSLFWPKFGWRALEICNQKCLLQIGRPRRLPVISNHISVVSRRNALIAISVQKLVAMVTSLCTLCMKVSQRNSLIAQTLSQNQTLHGYVIYNWSYCHFDIFAYFGQNLLAMATFLKPLQSEMSSSSLDWPTTKTPCYK